MNNAIDYWYQKYQKLKKRYEATVEGFLIGDKDFEVIHTTVGKMTDSDYSIIGEQEETRPLITFTPHAVKPGQKVKAIIVADDGKES